MAIATDHGRGCINESVPLNDVTNMRRRCESNDPFALAGLPLINRVHPLHCHRRSAAGMVIGAPRHALPQGQGPAQVFALDIPANFIPL